MSVEYLVTCKDKYSRDSDVTSCCGKNPCIFVYFLFIFLFFLLFFFYVIQKYNSEHFSTKSCSN